MSDGFFDTVFGPMGQGVAAVPQAIAMWLHAFAMRGTPKITARLLLRDPCEHAPACNHRLVGGLKCLKCRKTICLGHAFFTANADAVCFQCVGVTEGPPAPDGSEPRTKASRALAAAYATIGLEPGASKAEVERAVKLIFRDNHPDRGKGLPKQEIAARAQRWASANEARDLIKKEMGW